MLQTDVILVGAGPIGLEIAISLKREGIDYLQFDAEQIGYTISWFAPGTRFFSSAERIAIGGVPLQTLGQEKATREEYLAYLRSVVGLFKLEIQTYESVTDIKGDLGQFVVLTRTSTGETASYGCRRIVLATGGTARPRRLHVPGEDLPHVSSYLRDPHIYFRQRVLIVGGKNSAIEAALRCHRVGADVTLSYRGASLDPKNIKYWLLPEINGLIHSGSISAHFRSAVTRITPRGIDLRNMGNGQIQFIPAQMILLMIGYEADMRLFELAGIELTGDGQAPRYDGGTMETSVPGIYVAGTAICGTQQRYNVFIENCHVHAERIIASLQGKPAVTTAAVPFAQPES